MGNIVGHQREAPIGPNAKGYTATDAAVGAGRFNLPYDERGRFFRTDGPRGTGGDALPA